MVSTRDDFPGRARPMNWYAYADGSIYEFTPADNVYTDAVRFRTAARMWARRNGYRLTSSLIPSGDEGVQPSVVIRFTRL